MALTDKLTAVADAIRAKTGGTEAMTLDQMPTKIASIETGGGGAEFNIAYGATAPEDTSKLWIKTAEPVGVRVHAKVTGNGKLESFVSAMPEGVKSMGTAAVGSKVYLFGGYKYGGYLTTIRKFDAESQTITTLDTTLPTGINAIAAAAVGKKVYLFGGWDTSNSAIKTIFMFDTESESLTTLDAELSKTAYSVAAAAVGTKVYLFGGSSDSSNRDTIQVFDADTNTISTLSAKLPTATDTTVAAIGTDIYVFGGTGLTTIHVFDTKTNTLSLLSTALPKALSSLPAVAVGTKVYLFGNSGRSSEIHMFDAENETVTCLDDTLPTAANSIGAAAVGNKVYLFGGGISSSAQSSAIHAFVISMPLEENVMLIETSQTENILKLFTGESVEIACGVANVYRGNAQGLAEKVAAAVYKDGAWVEI